MRSSWVSLVISFLLLGAAAGEIVEFVFEGEETEKAPISLDNFLDQLSKDQLDDLADVASLFLADTFYNRLVAEFGEKPDPRFPLLPILLPNPLPEQLCVNGTGEYRTLINTTEQIPIILIMLELQAGIMEDLQISGLNTLRDDLAISIPAPGEISVGWRLDLDLLDILMGVMIKAEIVFDEMYELPKLTAEFGTTGLKISKGYLSFLAKGKILPLNETMRFTNLDLDFGADAFSWLTSYDIVWGENKPIGEGDLGWVYNLTKNVWNLAKPLILPPVTCMIDHVVNDCRLVDILANQTDCLKPPFPSDCLSPRPEEQFRKLGAQFAFPIFGDVGAFEVGTCPTATVPTTKRSTEDPDDSTDEPEYTTQDNSGSPFISGSHFLVLLTTTMMYVLHKVV